MISSLGPSLIAGLLLLAVFSGLAVGLIAIGRGRRGDAWWLMTIGSALCLACPILYLTVGWKLSVYYSTPRSSSDPPAIDFALYYGSGTLACFFGLLVFAAGFVRHGLDVARSHARTRGIEQALAGMEQLISRSDRGEAETQALIPPPDLDMVPKRVTAALSLLVCVGVGTVLWAGCVGLDFFSRRDTGWTTVCLFLLAALAVGIWTCLGELRHAHGGNGSNRGSIPHPRGASGWLMAIGTVCSVGPVFVILLMFVNDIPKAPGPLGAAVLFVLLLLIAPLGIVFFATGFALHGLKVVRHRERIRELEQIRAAMEEEVSRLGEGT